MKKTKKLQFSDFWMLMGSFLALGLIFGVNSIWSITLGIIFLGIICFIAPKISLTLLIFSVALGELGRINLGNFGFLVTDLLAIFTLISTLSYAKKTQPSKYILWFLGFVVVALLSIFVNAPALDNAVILKSLLYLARFATYGGLLFTIPAFLEKTKTQNYFFRCVIITALITAILGFLQLYFFPDFEELGLNQLGWDPHQGRLTSTWMDPNFVGGYFAFIITLLVSHMLKEKSHRLIFGLLMLILLVALYFTFSRSAYLALAVGLGVVALFQARWLIVAGGLGIIIILGSGTRASERIWDMADSFTAMFGSETSVLDPTARLRVENWQEGMGVVQDNPLLGTGYGTYGEVQWERGNLTDQDAHHASGADSSLLTVWATTGTLGLLFFLGFIISLELAILRSKNALLSIGILAGLVGIFAHSFFVNSLFFTLMLAGIIPVIGLLGHKKSTHK